MLVSGDRVLVGVSGGPDSLALLHLLYSLEKELNSSLYLAHLNHMFRGKEAEEDARYVKKLARTFNLPLRSKSFDVPAFSKKEKLSEEVAARQIRYEFLSKTALQYKANKIALGHTEDDQIETILMRLIRGAGQEGLKGIPPVRILNLRPRIEIVRPLIETSRSEIESYLTKHNLKARLDSSNLKPIYLRNKIRLELLPLLRKYNPKIKEVLLSTAEILKEEEEYLQRETEKVLNRIIKEKGKGRISLKLKTFSNYPKALQRRVLREAIRFIQGDLQGFTFQHYENILKLVKESPTGSQIDLPHNVAVQKDYGQLNIFKKKLEKTPSFNYVLKTPGITKVPELDLRIEIKLHPYHESAVVEGLQRRLAGARFKKGVGKIGKDKMSAYFDYKKLKFPLILRSKKPGDRFTPLGLKGSKKIKDFFIDRKIPRSQRKRIPLLLSAGEIIWVVGEEIDERVKVTARTKKIVKATCYFKKNVL
jgi:tRNA(Ile)-lysidine synthase